MEVSFFWFKELLYYSPTFPSKNFFVHPDKNGNIILIIKITDPYANVKKGDLKTILE